MIADTIEHIRKNKGQLINFYEGNWYKEGDGEGWDSDVLSLLHAPLLKPVSYYTKMNNRTVWVIEDEVAYTLMYPEDY